jgi:hypothetical protein
VTEPKKAHPAQLLFRVYNHADRQEQLIHPDAFTAWHRYAHRSGGQIDMTLQAVYVFEAGAPLFRVMNHDLGAAETQTFLSTHRHCIYFVKKAKEAAAP